MPGLGAGQYKRPGNLLPRIGQLTWGNMCCLAVDFFICDQVVRMQLIWQEKKIKSRFSGKEVYYTISLTLLFKKMLRSALHRHECSSSIPFSFEIPRWCSGTTRGMARAWEATEGLSNLYRTTILENVWIFGDKCQNWLQERAHGSKNGLGIAFEGSDVVCIADSWKPWSYLPRHLIHDPRGSWKRTQPTNRCGRNAFRWPSEGEKTICFNCPGV